MENKQTRGRQKIDIKKIEKEEDRLVTLSKRRAGVFKKASELCTLCGVEIALIIFSSSDKPFSFAHPNIESIANRVLNQNPQTTDNAAHLFEVHSQAKIEEYNEKLNQMLDRLEVEKEQGKRLDQMAQARQIKGWWEGPVNEFTKEQTQSLAAWINELQVKISKRLSKLVMHAAAIGTNDPNVAGPSYAKDPMHSKNN